MKYPPFLQLNRKPRVEIVPARATGDSIPKIIHQTFHGEPWPREIHDNISKLKEINSSWEYRFYSDNDIVSFLENEYGAKILGYYNRLNAQYGAARADLFRYLLMYRYGGVYLDIKAAADKPLDTVIRKDDRYLLSMWKNKRNDQFHRWGVHAELEDFKSGEFQQWHIVTAPGHPFLKAVIEYVCRNIDCYVPSIHGYGAFATLRVTGPISYSLAIKPLLDDHPHRFVDSNEDLGFRYSIFDSDNSRSHENVFRSHYKSLTSPLVKIGMAKELIYLPHKCLKGVAKRLLNHRP
jgi:hypothetical protein